MDEFDKIIDENFGDEHIEVLDPIGILDHDGEPYAVISAEHKSHSPAGDTFEVQALHIDEIEDDEECTCDDAEAKLYGMVCDAIERSYQGMPMNDGTEPMHTSDKARTGATEIFKMLGIIDE